MQFHEEKGAFPALGEGRFEDKEYKPHFPKNGEVR
jgi:hypothetical protein